MTKKIWTAVGVFFGLALLALIIIFHTHGGSEIVQAIRQLHGGH